MLEMVQTPVYQTQGRRKLYDVMTAPRALTLALLLIRFELDEAATRSDNHRYPGEWIAELIAAQKKLIELKKLS